MPSTLEHVAAGTRTRRFRRGEIIFHAGDPGDALFIIVSGEVKIALPSEEGDEAILAILRPGDVFGELALLDGAPRSATASALDRRPRPSSCRATGSASWSPPSRPSARRCWPRWPGSSAG